MPRLEFGTHILIPTNKLRRKVVTCDLCGVVAQAWRMNQCLRLSYRHAAKHGENPALEYMRTHDYHDLPFRPEIGDFL